jgi:hypothetical protein
MALTLGRVGRCHELELGTGGMKPMNEQHFAILRPHMAEVIGIHTDLLEEELGKAVLDKRILTVMLRIPRHLFVPETLAQLAYQDTPLPIGFEKTISQPFMCALMTDLLAPERHETVLDQDLGTDDRHCQCEGLPLRRLRLSRDVRGLDPHWRLLLPRSTSQFGRLRRWRDRRRVAAMGGFRTFPNGPRLHRLAASRRLHLSLGFSRVSSKLRDGYRLTSNSK